MKTSDDDFYFDFYKGTKLTIEEIRQFKEYENLSDEELHDMADKLYDLALVALKIATARKE